MSDESSAELRIECTDEELARWRTAAVFEQLSLEGWVRALLNSRSKIVEARLELDEGRTPPP